MTEPARSDDSLDLLRRASEMLRSGRPGAARPLLNAFQKTAAPTEDSLNLEASLLVREGRLADALRVLDTAIGIYPASVSLRLCRSATRFHAHDFAGAAGDAAEAVALAPDTARAKAVLGIALLELDRPHDALTCLTEAVAAAPADPAYRQALARAQDVTGQAGEALQTLEAGIAVRPDHLGLRTSAILLQLNQRAFRKAEELAESARTQGAADACVLGLLGHARSSLGQHDAAAEAFEDARKLAAEDPYVRHLVASGGSAAIATRAAPEYVKAVFDGCAERFDAHQVEQGYRLPGIFRRELASAGYPRPGDLSALDLGCGTGLLAVAVSDLFARLVGVDLSAGMLHEAERRGIYEELIQADIEAFLASDGRLFAVVLAADVLPYLGDLRKIFGAVASRLAPGGCFMFTVESLEADRATAADWQLGQLGRYAHAPRYVEQAAVEAGLRVKVIRHEVIRTEAGVPLDGLFGVLQRAAI